jgi:hypothetical protein
LVGRVRVTGSRVLCDREGLTLAAGRDEPALVLEHGDTATRGRGTGRCAPVVSSYVSFGKGEIDRGDAVYCRSVEDAPLPMRLLTGHARASRESDRPS